MHNLTDHTHIINPLIKQISNYHCVCIYKYSILMCCGWIYSALIVVVAAWLESRQLENIRGLGVCDDPFLSGWPSQTWLTNDPAGPAMTEGISDSLMRLQGFCAYSNSGKRKTMLWWEIRKEKWQNKQEKEMCHKTSQGEQQEKAEKEADKWSCMELSVWNGMEQGFPLRFTHF